MTEVGATFGNQVLPSSGGEGKTANGAWTENKRVEQEFTVAAHVCAARLASHMSGSQTRQHQPGYTHHLPGPKLVPLLRLSRWCDIIKMLF